MNSDRTGASAGSPALVRLQRGDRASLICFPPAGGSASVFQPWAGMARRVDLWAVELLGRRHRRAHPTTTRPDLASQVAAALADVTAQPMIFNGHNLGAHHAFDAVRALACKAGRTPDLPVVGTARAPNPDVLVEIDDAHIHRTIEELGGWAPQVGEDEELMHCVMGPPRADFALPRESTPDVSPVACPILALCSAEDAHVTAHEMCTWSRHTTGSFDCRMLPDGHFFHQASARQVVELVLVGGFALWAGRRARSSLEVNMASSKRQAVVHVDVDRGSRPLRDADTTRGGLSALAPVNARLAGAQPGFAARYA